MEEHNNQPITRSTLAKAVVVFFWGPLAVWFAFAKLLRRGGWRLSLIIISVAFNLFSAVVFILAFAIADEDLGVDVEECSLAVPSGFECTEQGPLYFGKVQSDHPEADIVGNSIIVAQAGCIVASFELSESETRINSAVLYDATCFSRVELDPLTGATYYTIRDDNGNVRFSIMDRDGDGVPDMKIDWSVGKSFKRTSNLTWEPASDQPS